VRVRFVTPVSCVLGVLLIASAVSGQAPVQAGPVTVLSREGRRTLATVEVQNHLMVGLDDLANLFQLQIREDAAARAVTATYKNQTIVLTPEQSLVSASGRLVSLPAPLTRRGNRWLVPVEFISRALAPVYDVRLDYRPASRLLAVGDLRVPRVTARYDDTPGMLRVTFEITPRSSAVVTDDQSHLLLRIEADALDVSLPPAPSAQGVLTGIRATDPATIQMDLGPRFASFRSALPVSSGAAAVVTVELLAAPADSTAAPAIPPPAASAAPLPVFTAGARPTIRTIVIDPGHGGEDNGVTGRGGTLEKNLTLSISRRVKAVIEGGLGMRVILTHEDDRRIDAEGRVAIANNNKADLFISLHANGSPREAARGASIFTLSLDRFGEDARRQSQAEREVLPVFGGGSREISLVEWELAQAAHLDQSNSFAAIIDQKLRNIGRLPSVTLQRALIRNLAGANMPAVLIEVGYLSNHDEEKLLTSSDFQNDLAQAITESVVAFRDYLEQGSQTPPPMP
jgi:N-acetylmuramoyl-L-alanine amidase